MANGLGGSLWELLLAFGRNRDKAKQIKTDPEKTRKCKQFGIMSIIMTVVAAVCSFALLAFTWMDTGIIIAIFAIVVGVVLGIAGTILFLIYAIMFWCFQIYVNRRAITWISLGINIAVIVAAAIGLSIFLGII